MLNIDSSEWGMKMKKNPLINVLPLQSSMIDAYTLLLFKD
jgi:hypothetical protein